MEHSYFQDRLSAYHDNELPLQEKVVVDEHVKSCSECQQLLQKYKSLDQLVSDHGQLGDTDYWEKAAQAIDRKIGQDLSDKILSVSAARRRFDLGWKLAAVAATVVIVGYIGIHKDEIFTPEKVVPRVTAPAGQPPAGQNEVAPSGLNSPAPLRQQKPVAPSQDELKKSDRNLDSGGSRRAAVKDQSDNYKAEPTVEEKAQVSPAQASESAPSQQPKAVATISSNTISDSARKVIARPLAAPQALGIVKSDSTQVGEFMEHEQQLGRQAIKVASEKEVTEARGKSDTALGLTYWRGLRDSLVPKGTDSKQGLYTAKLREAIAPNLQKPKPQLQSAADSDTSKKSSSRLVEAWYQIARLTSDSRERSEARAALEGMARSETSPDRDRARAYLDSLEIK